MLRVRKKLFVIVDGVTYSADDKLEIDGHTDEIEDWEAMEANGFTARCYLPGITTWTVTVTRGVVYHGTGTPTRTETEDSITYTMPPQSRP